MSPTIVSGSDLAGPKGKARRQPGSRLVRLVTDTGSGCPPGSAWSGPGRDFVGRRPGGAGQ